MKILLIAAIAAAGIITAVVYGMTVMAGRIDKALGYKDKENDNGT